MQEFVDERCICDMTPENTRTGVKSEKREGVTRVWSLGKWPMSSQRSTLSWSAGSQQEWQPQSHPLRGEGNLQHSLVMRWGLLLGADSSHFLCDPCPGAHRKLQSQERQGLPEKAASDHSSQERQGTPASAPST